MPPNTVLLQQEEKVVILDSTALFDRLRWEAPSQLVRVQSGKKSDDHRHLLSPSSTSILPNNQNSVFQPTRLVSVESVTSLI